MSSDNILESDFQFPQTRGNFPKLDRIEDLLKITNQAEMTDKINKNIIILVKSFQQFYNDLHDSFTFGKEEVDMLIYSLKFVDTLNLFMPNNAIYSLQRKMKDIFDVVQIFNGLLDQKDLILKKIKYTDMTIIDFKKKLYQKYYFEEGGVNLAKEMESNINQLVKNGKFDQHMFKQLQNIFYVVQNRIEEPKRQELQNKMNELKTLSIKYKRQKYSSSGNTASSYYNTNPTTEESNNNDYYYKGFSNVNANLYDYNENFYDDTNYYEEDYYGDYSTPATTTNTAGGKSHFYSRGRYRGTNYYGRKYYDNDEKEVEVSSTPPASSKNLNEINDIPVKEEFEQVPKQYSNQPENNEQKTNIPEPKPESTNTDNNFNSPNQKPKDIYDDIEIIPVSNVSKPYYNEYYKKTNYNNYNSYNNYYNNNYYINTYNNTSNNSNKTTQGANNSNSNQPTDQKTQTSNSTSSSTTNTYNPNFKKKIITKKNQKQRGATLVELPYNQPASNETEQNTQHPQPSSAIAIEVPYIKELSKPQKEYKVAIEIKDEVKQPKEENPPAPTVNNEPPATVAVPKEEPPKEEKASSNNMNITKSNSNIEYGTPNYGPPSNNYFNGPHSRRKLSEDTEIVTNLAQRGGLNYKIYNSSKYYSNYIPGYKANTYTKGYYQTNTYNAGYYHNNNYYHNTNPYNNTNNLGINSADSYHRRNTLGNKKYYYAPKQKLDFVEIEDTPAIRKFSDDENKMENKALDAIEINDDKLGADEEFKNNKIEDNQNEFPDVNLAKANSDVPIMKNNNVFNPDEVNKEISGNENIVNAENLKEILNVPVEIENKVVDDNFKKEEVVKDEDVKKEENHEEKKEEVKELLNYELPKEANNPVENNENTAIKVEEKPKEEIIIQPNEKKEEIVKQEEPKKEEEKKDETIKEEPKIEEVKKEEINIEEFKKEELKEDIKKEEIKIEQLYKEEIKIDQEHKEEVKIQQEHKEEIKTEREHKEEIKTDDIIKEEVKKEEINIKTPIEEKTENIEIIKEEEKKTLENIIKEEPQTIIPENTAEIKIENKEEKKEENKTDVEILKEIINMQEQDIKQQELEGEQNYNDQQFKEEPKIQEENPKESTSNIQSENQQIPIKEELNNKPQEQEQIINNQEPPKEPEIKQEIPIKEENNNPIEIPLKKEEEIIPKPPQENELPPNSQLNNPEPLIQQPIPIPVVNPLSQLRPLSTPLSNINPNLANLEKEKELDFQNFVFSDSEINNKDYYHNPNDIINEYEEEEIMEDYENQESSDSINKEEVEANFNQFIKETYPGEEEDVNYYLDENKNDKVIFEDEDDLEKKILLAKEELHHQVKKENKFVEEDEDLGEKDMIMMEDKNEEEKEEEDDEKNENDNEYHEEEHTNEEIQKLFGNQLESLIGQNPIDPQNQMLLNSAVQLNQLNQLGQISQIEQLGQINQLNQLNQLAQVNPEINQEEAIPIDNNLEESPKEIPQEIKNEEENINSNIPENLPSPKQQENKQNDNSANKFNIAFDKNSMAPNFTQIPGNININELSHNSFGQIQNNNIANFANNQGLSSNVYRDSLSNVDPKLLSAIKSKINEDYNNKNQQQQNLYSQPISLFSQANQNTQNLQAQQKLLFQQQQLQKYLQFNSVNPNILYNPIASISLLTFNRLQTLGKISKNGNFANFYYHSKDANIHKDYLLLKAQEFDNPSIFNKNLFNFENKILIPLYQKITSNAFKKRELYNITYERYRKVITKAVKDKVIKQISPYGSFVNNFLLDSGDIDICIVPKIPITDFQTYLDKIKDEIKSKGIGIHKLSHHTNRYSLLRIADIQSKFIVDIAVHTMLPILNTQLLRLYSLYDQRFHILGLYIKHWAKINKIHGAADNYLSSYALILMLINFLQKRVEPRVLPNLQRIVPNQEKRLEYNYNGHEITTNVYYEEDMNKINAYMNSINNGLENKEKAVSLLLQFFEYYAYNFDGDIKISISRNDTIKDKSDNIAFSIEDPFDIMHNPGKSMIKNSVPYFKFMTAMKKEINYIYNGEYVKRLEKIIRSSGGVFQD